jgi:hypothetical protein
MQTRYKMIGVGAIAVVFAAAAWSDAPGSNDDDPPSRSVTPSAAACEMIADGDTAEEAYDILLGLEVRPAAALRAVNRAIAGDC